MKQSSLVLVHPSDEQAPRRKGKVAKSEEVRLQELVTMADVLGQNPNPFETGDAGRAPKILAACSLPYKRPIITVVTPKGEHEKKDATTWERQNGDYSLLIQGGRQGIPYGIYPRLFLFWLCGEANRTGSPLISTGDSFADFCRQLQIDPSRGSRSPGGLMIQQTERLLDSRLMFYNRRESANMLASRGDFLQIAEKRELFWDARNPEQKTVFESVIQLSDAFHKELTEQFIPIDMRTIQFLRKRESSLELDILLWLSYRLYQLNATGRTAKVTWPQLYQQFGSSMARLRDFRNQSFLPALKTVCSLYPKADVAVQEDGVLLGPKSTLIPRKLFAVKG